MLWGGYEEMQGSGDYGEAKRWEGLGPLWRTGVVGNCRNVLGGFAGSRVGVKEVVVY